MLIIGVKGLGAEVAKNITLAGVKSVTLLDDGAVTLDDICAQFLVPRDQLGKNVSYPLRFPMTSVFFMY